MIFKSKKGETMVWLEELKKMATFDNGIIDADEKVAKELIKLGYSPDNSKKDTGAEAPVKPIKPIKSKGLEVPDSEINSEV